MLNYSAGICGLISVIFINILAYTFGYDRTKIIKGFYGFNALLTGLGLGLSYQLSGLFILVLFFVALLILMITVALEGILGKYYLPYLSLPFLFAIWISLIAFPKFSFLKLNDTGMYHLNNLYYLGGDTLVNVTIWWENLFHTHINTYFGSIGAIFFQYGTLAGFLVAIGILYHSRIAFTLSIVGFVTAVYIYQLLGVVPLHLPFTYIGFNYILFAIAIGGYFIIPSKYSYLAVIIVTPALVFMNLAFNDILEIFKLPVYSLAFNINVLLFVYLMKLRYRHTGKLTEVTAHYSTPEKSLYTYKNNNVRFKNKTYFSLRLPFFGDWFVSQAHEGSITHKDRWRYAWDFVIKDENNSTYKNGGDKLENFYCYNKAVLSPADGEVSEVNDGIRDNEIGDVNLEENWGNTIVIKHAEHFYSQLSHLKAGSIKVQKGDVVKAGQLIAAVGNSGRSPEPHLHFQLQAIQEIGSETLNYPIGHYLLKSIKNNGSDYLFKNYEIPNEGDVVSNHYDSKLLVNAFHFTPGQELNLRNEKGELAKWKVITDIYNKSYIQCGKTNAKAYFSNEDRVFYFYDYAGSKKTILYDFFLAVYKIPLGFYDDMEINDTFAIYLIYDKIKLFIQDFIAPFFIYLRADYKLVYDSVDNLIIPSKMTLKSYASKKNKLFKEYIIVINNKVLKHFYILLIVNK